MFDQKSLAEAPITTERLNAALKKLYILNFNQQSTTMTLRWSLKILMSHRLNIRLLQQQNYLETWEAMKAFTEQRQANMIK